MIRPRLWLSVSVLGWVVTLAGACSKPPADAAAGKQKEAEAPPAKVTLTPVAEAQVPTTVALSGTLLAEQASDVAAGAAGKVRETFAERGTVVKKGDVLVRLDARSASAAATEAQAQLQLNKAQADLARSECERAEQLYKQGAISQAEHDRTASQCKTAFLAANAAAARNEAVTVSLTDTDIRAPFSGFVAERYVSAGEYVRADTKVATVLATDNLRVELTVPEQYAAQIKEGQLVDFRPAADQDAASVEGKVRYVGPAIRRQSRDLVVEAVVANAEHNLRPGTFVVARLRLGEQKALVAPRSAVLVDGTTSRVFVAKGGRLEERIVQLGEKVGDQVVILRGLDKGDQIVTTPAGDLHDGQRIAG